MTKENENNKEQEDLKETWVNEELQVEESLPEEKPSWFSQNKTLLIGVAIVLLGIAIVFIFKGTTQEPPKEEKSLYTKFSERWEKANTTQKVSFVATVTTVAAGTVYVIYNGPKQAMQNIRARFAKWFKKSTEETTAVTPAPTQQ